MVILSVCYIYLDDLKNLFVGQRLLHKTNGAGKIVNLEKKEKIDRLHKINLFKLQMMPMFEPSKI